MNTSSTNIKAQGQVNQQHLAQVKENIFRLTWSTTDDYIPLEILPKSNKTMQEDLTDMEVRPRKFLMN